LIEKVKLMLEDRLLDLTVPSSDDGKRFVITKRLDRIVQFLADSEYECFGDRPLAKIYRRRDFQSAHPFVLVSNHMDSLYKSYFSCLREGVFHGTFDNSASNAVAIEMMLTNPLPAQVLITFTGDEESRSKGAVQTVEFLKTIGIFDRLEMAITLDLTEESYGEADSTVENYFVRKNHHSALLRFTRKRDLKDYLKKILGSPVFVKDAEEDESWMYDEYDLNCFSLCLPCRPLEGDMHSDAGVTFTEDSIEFYMKTLGRLTEAIVSDLRSDPGIHN